MQRSLFDKIYLAFLAIMIVSFLFLIFFISYFTRRSLISEKQQTLYNESRLIANQILPGYELGNLNRGDLALYLDYYSNTLDADIWYVDRYGTVVSVSMYNRNAERSSSTDAAAYPNLSIPDSIYELDPAYDLHNSHTEVSDFYGIYDTKVITVSIPTTIISTDMKSSEQTQYQGGTLILNASTSQINSSLTEIYTISFIPCLVIIAIAFIFLSIISRKIIKPIKNLSNVANSYSIGDFDVRTDIDSNDEIGTLSKSMEYMADELSKLEQYRKDFISNVSHDFRSPLTSIRGYVQAMSDGTIPPEKQDRYLQIILNETDRLTKLTQGLLDLNTLEMYGTYLKQSDFDFIEIVKPTLNTFEMKCVDKGIAIYLNNHAKHTEVTADKTKIQQVVYNLIDNAIKFTPSGKKIYVTINELKGKLLVSVRDEGIGMDEYTRKRIFTRFYKGDTSRGKDKQGSGLGLAIAKDIIKAHNETIEVRSEEGKGTEFIFTLPLAKDQTADHTGQTEILMTK